MPFARLRWWLRMCECWGCAPEDPKVHRNLRLLHENLFDVCINPQEQPKVFSCRIRYLVHWHMSLYRLVLYDMLVWMVMYAGVNLIYRFGLNPEQKEKFVQFVNSVTAWQTNVPITFVLGFYATTVMDKWWKTYMAIPVIDNICLQFDAAICSGSQPAKAEQIRVTLTRYFNLAWLLCMHKLSRTVKNRIRFLRSFLREAYRLKVLHARRRGKTNNFQVEAEIIDEDELLSHFPNINKLFIHYDSTACLCTTTTTCLSCLRCRFTREKKEAYTLLEILELFNQDPVVQETYGVIVTPGEVAAFERRARSDGGGRIVEHELPMHWAVALIRRAFKEGFVDNSDAYNSLKLACSEWSSKLAVMHSYATKNLPIVYTQVVIIAVYTWALVEVFASQNLEERVAGNKTCKISACRIDMYAPWFSLLKWLFYVSWLKVALVMLDPFCRDPDGLPFSTILNSNLRLGRQLGAFNADLLPRKLRQPAADGKAQHDFLHSDDESGQDCRRTKPWLLTVDWACRAGATPLQSLGNEARDVP